MGILSNIFKRNDQSSAGSISISKEELEEVIVCALLKAEEKRQEKEALKAKKDDLMGTVKGILCGVLLIVAVILLFVFLSMLLSFIFPKSKIFQSLVEMSDFARWFALLFSGVYCLGSLSLCRAVWKETDRAFLISYFSSITSIVSLFIALYGFAK